MGKDKGWIKLDRSITENWIYEADAFDYFHAFVDLLLMASFEEHKIKVKGKVIESKPGQVITTIPALAKRWGWSENRVRRFLRTLCGSATVTTDGTPDGTSVTFVNWAKYQGRGRADGRDDGRDDGSPDGRGNGRTDGTHQKNGKNGKNEKEGARARARTLSLAEKMEAIRRRGEALERSEEGKEASDD